NTVGESATGDLVATLSSTTVAEGTPVGVTVTDGGATVTATTYQWQVNHGSGFVNATGTGATTASYTPSEGDEGGTRQVLVSYGSDPVSTETATSNTSSAVQDASPTVSAPTISSNDSAGSSTVREGDVLTASATSGQADNLLTYAWYSSADNYTNP